jgi:hypothetical protein
MFNITSPLNHITKYHGESSEDKLAKLATDLLRCADGKAFSVYKESIGNGTGADVEALFNTIISASEHSLPVLVQLNGNIYSLSEKNNQLVVADRKTNTAFRLDCSFSFLKSSLLCDNNLHDHDVFSSQISYGISDIEIANSTVSFSTGNNLTLACQDTPPAKFFATLNTLFYTPKGSAPNPELLENFGPAAKLIADSPFNKNGTVRTVTPELCLAVVYHLASLDDNLLSKNGVDEQRLRCGLNLISHLDKGTVDDIVKLSSKINITADHRINLGDNNIKIPEHASGNAISGLNNQVLRGSNTQALIESSPSDVAVTRELYSQWFNADAIPEPMNQFVGAHVRNLGAAASRPDAQKLADSIETMADEHEMLDLGSVKIVRLSSMPSRSNKISNSENNDVHTKAVNVYVVVSNDDEDDGEPKIINHRGGTVYTGDINARAHDLFSKIFPDEKIEELKKKGITPILLDMRLLDKTVEIGHFNEHKKAMTAVAKEKGVVFHCALVHHTFGGTPLASAGLSLIHKIMPDPVISTNGEIKKLFNALNGEFKKVKHEFGPKQADIMPHYIKFACQKLAKQPLDAATGLVVDTVFTHLSTHVPGVEGIVGCASAKDRTPAELATMNALRLVLERRFAKGEALDLKKLCANGKINSSAMTLEERVRFMDDFDDRLLYIMNNENAGVLTNANMTSILHTLEDFKDHPKLAPYNKAHPGC